jgi:hypothetical protein
MRKIIVLTFALAIAATAFAQTSQFKSMRQACSSCCKDMCGDCCKDGCKDDCCKGNK